MFGWFAVEFHEVWCPVTFHTFKFPSNTIIAPLRTWYRVVLDAYWYAIWYGGSWRFQVSSISIRDSPIRGQAFDVDNSGEDAIYLNDNEFDDVEITGTERKGAEFL
ncbi:hypothetical protein E3N88_09841 [Mikania micrantha]|uniref:Uncharacterized protein n=1 Tax=Mikania micrantha TaxID=192012 RepID=A0A5N6PNA5_9ASTR|nr:hypothetical protein E3N88_09841 [Mikania micrantha]